MSILLLHHVTDSRPALPAGPARTLSASLSLVGKRFSLLLLLVLLLFAGRSVRADITIKPDQKDGDKISDIAKIVVRADSGDGIDKVEFAVDDQLRYSSGSTPYIYTWDTIKDTEGAHSLAITAIDSNGQKKTVTLSLTIDNELNLGAAGLAQKAQQALAAKDTEAAIRYSRRTLKVEPDNIDASRIIAAVFASKLDWDKAVTTLEKAKSLDASVTAMSELATYRIRRALLPENAQNFFIELAAISDLRRKSNDLNIQRTKAQNPPSGVPATPVHHDTLGDAYLAAGRYREAVQEYRRSGENGPLTSTNRYALATIADNRPDEAAAQLRVLVKTGGGDAATRAVLGLALLRQRHFEEARAVVSSDLSKSYPAALIVAAYADAVLGNQNLALKEAHEAVSLVPDSGDAYFALSMAERNLVDQESALVKAVTLTPFESGLYLDFAARVAVQKQQDRFEMAQQYIDYVLKSDPDNVNAKIIQVLIDFQTKRIKEAEPILGALLKKDAVSPDLMILAAIYFDLKDQPTAVNDNFDKARKADAVRFDYARVPKPLEYLYSVTRKYHYRAGFFLTPTSLYPPKPAEQAAQ